MITNGNEGWDFPNTTIRARKNRQSVIRSQRDGRTAAGCAPGPKLGKWRRGNGRFGLFSLDKLDLSEIQRFCCSSVASGWNHRSSDPPKTLNVDWPARKKLHSQPSCKWILIAEMWNEEPEKLWATIWVDMSQNFGQTAGSWIFILYKMTEK